MNFSVETMSGIVNKASEKLQSRTLGGVTKESALDAVQKGVSEALKKGEEAVSEAVAVVQKELAEFKGKSAQEMAELTSKKDELIKQTKEEADAALKAEIKKAKAVKVSSKSLDNGNTEIRKVNKNGALMVKEVTPDGKHIKSEVTNLAGDKRKTTFNPINGKPVKTFSNINGDHLTEYTSDGVMKSNKAVNVKKVKKEKPTLVTQTKPEYVDTRSSSERAMAFDKIYSDGSKETVTRVTDNGNRLLRTKVEEFNKEGEKTSEVINWSDNNKRTTIFGKNTFSETEESLTSNGEYFKRTIEKAYDDITGRWIEVGGENVANNTSMKYKVLKDEYGFYTDKCKAKITYPKESGKPSEIREGTLKEIKDLVYGLILFP